MIIDNNRIKNLMLGIGIILILLCVCMSVDYATNYTDDDAIVVTNNNTMNITSNYTIINGTYYYFPSQNDGVAKLHKIVTEKPKYPIVKITARPSCGCGRHYSYKWRTRTFVDYCPHCHRYGVLRNVHKPQAKWEQELTCKKCGADYCGNCGHEKYSWSKYYIRKI